MIIANDLLMNIKNFREIYLSINLYQPQKPNRILTQQYTSSIILLITIISTTKNRQQLTLIRHTKPISLNLMSSDNSLQIKSFQKSVQSDFVKNAGRVPSSIFTEANV